MERVLSIRYTFMRFFISFFKPLNEDGVDLESKATYYSCIIFQGVLPCRFQLCLQMFNPV